MSNRFIGIGNLGTQPTLKTIPGETQRQVADMRIFFDRPVKDPETDQYEDKGGFWLDISAWDRLADDVMRLFKKGMRVKIEGSLKLNSWQDEASGEERSRLVLYADEATLVLNRVETVVMQPKQSDGQPHE